MSMEWFIENKSMDKHSVAATKTYGTSRMDAYSIFEDTLNLKTVTVRDRIDDGDGKYHYEVNKNETMLAREKLDCQHFFRQIFLGYFSDIVQAFDTLRKNVCGDDYTSLHNPIVLSSVLPAYGMFHSIQILFL